MIWGKRHGKQQVYILPQTGSADSPSSCMVSWRNMSKGNEKGRGQWELSSFKHNSSLRSFWGLILGLGNSMRSPSSLLHQTGYALVKSAKENKSYTPTFAHLKSALGSGSVGNAIGYLFLLRALRWKTAHPRQGMLRTLMSLCLLSEMNPEIFLPCLAQGSNIYILPRAWI